MDNLINSPLDAELSKLSPFELKGRIIAAADEKVKNAAYTLLNAGRGNPNWLAIESRKAFFAIGMFAVEEAERDFSLPEGIAGVPQKGLMPGNPASTSSKALTNTPSPNSRPMPTRLSKNGPEESWDTTTPLHHASCPTPKKLYRNISIGQSAPATLQRTMFSTSSLSKALPQACATASMCSSRTSCSMPATL